MTKFLPSEYFNISQYRLDHWNKLKTMADGLYNAHRDREPIEEIKAEIDSIISYLSLLEQFWAFPGLTILTDLKDYYDKEELPD